MRLRATCSGLALAVILTLPGSLAAQVALGGGAGVTFSNFTGDDAEDLDNRTGFYVGGSLTFPLGGIVGLGTGAYYVQKGAQESSDLGEASIELAYLEVPVLLQVQATRPERPVGVGLFLGPSFSFNLSCDGTPGAIIEFSGDCSDDVKSFELGALFGAGLSFAAGQSATISINGGLDLGLTSIDDVGDDDRKNQAYFLGVGLSVPVGG